MFDFTPPIVFFYVIIALIIKFQTVKFRDQLFISIFYSFYHFWTLDDILSRFAFTSYSILKFKFQLQIPNSAFLQTIFLLKIYKQSLFFSVIWVIDSVFYLLRVRFFNGQSSRQMSEFISVFMVSEESVTITN